MDTTIQMRMTIPARIDRLPLSREIWGIMLLAGVAWLVESYDVGVIGSVLPSLVKEFHLGATSLGLLAIASTLGIVLAVIPAGWRTLFYVGAFPLVYVPILLKWMPESPRWLEVKGHIREADAIVSRLEHDIERRTGEQLPPPQIADIEAKSDTGGAINWASTDGAIVRTRQKGYGTATAFLLTTIIVIASIPGKYAAAFAVERFGRKATLISFTGAAAVAAVLFGLSSNAMLSLSCGILLAFFGVGVDPIIKIYGAEQYPTRIRETGIGLFEGVGRFFGGALAPYIMAFILASGSVLVSYIFVALVALVGIGTVAVLGTETKGRTIDHV